MTIPENLRIESSWTRVADMRVKRMHFGAAAVDEYRVVVAGGFDGRKPLSSVEMYDSRKNTWTPLPDMPDARYGCAAVAIEGKVYLIGGSRSSQHVDATLSVLDTTETHTQWLSLASMKRARSSSAAVVVGRHIYVFSGTSAERYSTERNQWEDLPPMSVSREKCTAAAIGNTIYLVGGSRREDECTDSVEAFHVKYQRWETGLPPIKMARLGSASVVVGRFLVIIGGYYNQKKALSSVEVFDTSTSSWSFLPKTLERHGGCAAAAIGGNQVFVFGGGGHGGSQPTNDVERIVMHDVVQFVHSQSIYGDTNKGPDLIGFQPDAYALAEVIADKNLRPPFVVGLLGAWGAGKSFFSHQIEEMLGKIQEYPTNRADRDFPYTGHIYLVKFDAWTYGKGNLWASLMLKILEALNQQLSFEAALRNIHPQRSENRDIGNLDDFDGSPQSLHKSNFGTGNNDDQGFEVPFRNSNIDQPPESVLQERVPLITQDRGSLDVHKYNGVLEKGINVIKVMEELASGNIAYLESALKGKRMSRADKEELLREVHRIFTRKGRVSEALLEAIDANYQNDKINLARARGMERAMMSTLSSELTRRLMWKRIHNCREDAMCALLDDANEKWEKEKRAKDSNIRKKRLKYGSKEPTIEEALNAFSTLEKYLRFIRAGNLTTFEWALFLILFVAAILLPLFFEQYEAFVATILPVIMAALKAIQNAEGKLAPLKKHFSKVNREEDLEGAIDSEVKNDLDKTREEIDSIEQRLWLRKGDSLGEAVRRRLDMGGNEKQLGVVHKAQEDLQRLSDAMLSRSGRETNIFPRGEPRIILFVDDLDRCPADKVVQMLEAMQLLVKSKLFVVVVAIDARYAMLALEKHYKDVLLTDGSPSGRDYIEKIIQLPYRIPPVRQDCWSVFLGDQMNIKDINGEDIPSLETEEDILDKNKPVLSHMKRVGTNTLSEPTVNESDTGRDHVRHAVHVAFDKTELNMVAYACSTASASPRTARRLVNVLKVMKIIWHRQGILMENEVKEACIVLLILCYSYSSDMHDFFFTMEEAKSIDSTLVNESLGQLQCNMTDPCKVLVDDKLAWDKVSWNRLKPYLRLVRSFSFLGEPIKRMQG